ncbi:MAG: GSCFA domain-containing protein [Flavobacteriaceae bacterium]|nr:GSCFA domain-containing protein [Flavobacteriaceae bacterium]
MKFRTELKIPQGINSIDYDSKTVLFGSCFTENIRKHFNYYKFQTNINSHGILFNPKSIEYAIHDCVSNREYNQHDLGYFDKLWLSFNHHSKFSSIYLAKILEMINKNITQTHESLINASHIVITLGTSWVYRYKKTENLVANCHKVPQKEFHRELLQIDQIKESLDQIIALIGKINTKANIIFTVSPVRHVKDGFVENTLSKAYLQAAIHQVIDNKNTFYFPAFEIMMDDLRDYRFYNKDLLHPNEIAMDYIWAIFKKTWISKSAYPMMKKIDKIQKSLNHKAFNENSEMHQEFLEKLDTKIKLITDKYPRINFKKKTV